MGVKVVDGRTLKFKPISDYITIVESGTEYDTWSHVFTSKDNPNASLMVERMVKGYAAEPTYTTTEIGYVLEGEGIGICEGKTIRVHKGDFILVEKGSTVRWQIDSFLTTVTFNTPALDAAYPQFRPGTV
ncbi:cupin domain-containing protein [Chloroflexota bacterium]